MIEDPNQAEARTLRQLLDDFVQQRLQPKLEELDKKLAKEERPEEAQALREKRQALIAAFQREPWLESAAKRSGQIQLVSHGLKFSHPNARGSSFFLHCDESRIHGGCLGTSTLGKERADDVVGNAAALDVYKFLSLEHQGKTLLELAAAGDAGLAAALCDDAAQAAEWMQAFAAVTQSAKTPTSHTLARQVYFPLDSEAEEYHLLAPLFPTSLMHAVHERIAEDRFSDAAKAARKLRREGKPSETGYRDYPGLAVQVFGGTKPQNISQLNSQRYGQNWLLPSAPPTWRSEQVRPPLHLKTVFGRRLTARPAMREAIQTLADFLAKTDYNNVRIRNARARMARQIVDELMLFAAETQELAPGWSADPACKLDAAETLWLDPRRAEADAAFDAERAVDWQDAIGKRFSAWLNHQLRRHKDLHLGDAEQNEWERDRKSVV